MSRGSFGTRALATIVIASFCLVGMSSSAEAGWGHHRHFGHYRHFGHHHHRAHFSFAWPSYRSYGFYGNFGYRNYGYSSYRSYYPVYYRSYLPSYYVTPYVVYGCYGYQPSIGFGGFYSANSVSADRLPSVEPTQMATNDQRAAGGNIELKLNVPEDARVTINDRPTSVAGSERDFVVRGGLLEVQYPFVVRAEIERNGQTITKIKQVDLRGGQVSSLTFDFDAQSPQVASVDEPVSTAVRLRVPEEARVFLAGYEMKQKGKIRVFETTKLRAGEELENYTVRVVMGNGKAESREKQLTLVGGETQEVEFDFTSSQRLVAR